MRAFDPETHPVQVMAVAPIRKLVELPFWARVWAFVGGAATTVWEDAFTGIILLAVISGGFDYYWGRKIHKRLGTFDPVKAELGLHSKAAGLVMVLLIRGAEHWLGTLELGGSAVLQTYGFVAAAVAFAFFVKDLDSIYAKRKQMGGGDLPLLATVLDWMRRIPERLFQPPAPPPPAEDTEVAES